MSLPLDRTAWFLIVSNAATIAVALYEGWSASEVMWIYWAQSIVIGLFNVLRILRMGEFSAEGVKMNDKPLESTPAAKRGVALFFALHYGLFHLGYFFFLGTGHPLPEGSDLLSMAACVGTFAVNHAFSYRENVEGDLARRPDIGSVMFYPYKRIMPMHMTIILGGFFAKESVWVLLLFFTLKTVADLKMHIAEHRDTPDAGPTDSPAPFPLISPMATGVQQGYLALADISGYTRFMAETELEHSQGIMAAFVNTLIGQLTPRMTLAEVEGDALFLYAPAQRMSRGETLMELIESAYVDFRKLQLTMARNATCACTACQTISNLDLKFVAHYGEFAIQDYAGKGKPVGSSVNLVHRLLKNNVSDAQGWQGYALFTNTALERMDIYPVNTFESKQSYEHFGEVLTYSSNLDERYRELMEQQPLRLSREDADITRSYRLEAPQDVVWEYLNDPAKRSTWMKKSAWHSTDRPRGRTGRGAKNHCSNSGVIEHILDWRPFDSCTVRYETKLFNGLLVSDLKPDGDGTILEWQFKMELPLPRLVRRPMAKFITLRVMGWEENIAELVKAIASGRTASCDHPPGA